MIPEAGSTFALDQHIAPIPGCTTSEIAWRHDGMLLAYFALAAETDISAESYPGSKIIWAESGQLQIFDDTGGAWNLEPGDTFVTPIDTPVGMRAHTDCVYAELTLKEGTSMNNLLKTGEVLKLADLLPYQDGKIINTDLVNNDHVKLALMSFGAGTGLSEHAAPGQALVFALDGAGIIGYEGEEHRVVAGQNFAFAKGGRHYVKADGPFKMALLLMKE